MKSFFLAVTVAVTRCQLHPLATASEVFISEALPAQQGLQIGTNKARRLLRGIFCPKFSDHNYSGVASSPGLNWRA